MKKTVPSARALRRTLDAELVRNARRLEPWHVRSDGQRPHPVTLPFRWRHAERPVVFEHTLEIERAERGRPLLLRLDVAEGLLLIDGAPFHGLDRYHRDVVLPPPLTREPRIPLAIEASRAAPFGGAWFKDAYVVPFREPTARLAHWVAALDGLRDTLPPGLDRDAVACILGDVERLVSPRRNGRVSEGAVSEAIALVADRCRRAGDARVSRATSDRRTGTTGTVHLVGHSHIDVVWLWTLAETRRKCARTFSTALRLMEAYPEFQFAQSQAQLYAFVQQDYPDLFAQIKARVREGRWHPVGSTWVEPDCNIPNGESLIRQVLHGRRYFAREFGVHDDVLWLPDTFGYAWSLPQILRQCGIRAFFTTKLLWNDTTRLPHNSFWWEGIDGSRVLAHNPPVGLEGVVTANHLRKSWHAYRERSRTAHVLQTFGYGDGGGGVTAEHLDAARVLETAPGLPHAQLSNVSEFFAALRRDGGRLPAWRDELYLELHRGTYTTHAWLKQANRRAEAALYVTDLLCALASGHANAASRRHVAATLDALWKCLLTNQFHDIVPGTAVEAAYADTRRDFEWLQQGCETLQATMLDRIAPRSPTASPGARTIVNPLPWARREIVTLPANAPVVAVRDCRGTTLPSQVVLDGRRPRVLCAVSVPAMGSTTILPGPDLLPRQSRKVRPPATPGELDTPHVRIAFDADGTISSFVDKGSGREIVPRGGRLNAFQTYRDEPPHWEAWDIDPGYQQKPVTVFRDAVVDVLECGPVRWRARVRWSSDSGSRLDQDICTYSEGPLVEFDTRVTWRERRTLLKVAFPLAVRTRRATYEIPFGAIARPTEPRTRRDRARWEVAGQQWADLSERGFGVSLLNDCKYGYDCRGTTLRLTLLRSPRYPHHAEPMTKTSGRYTDQGRHRFTYALLPHAGSWREGGTVRRARELNVPCLDLEGVREVRFAPLVSVASDNLQVSAVAPCDDTRDVCVRVYESHGVGGPAAIDLGCRCRDVRLVDLEGRTRRRLGDRQGRVRLTFRPFEIKTICLTPDQAPPPRGGARHAR